LTKQDINDTIVLSGGEKMSEQPELYTLQEVSKTLKVSSRTIRRYIKKGLITAHKLEGSYRITNKELSKFIEERKTKG
jgi:excisionase family DNA binding protein